VNDTSNYVTFSNGKKTTVEVTETERFDADGNLVEKTRVTVTRTEDVPVVNPTPYQPYRVWYDNERPTYTINVTSQEQ
jgi:hypothetical protein